MKGSSAATRESPIQAPLFRVLTDQSPRPTLMTNEKTEIVYVNRAWEQQFGYSLAEVQGKNPHMFQSTRTPSHIYKDMWLALREGKTFQTDEIIDRRKNGRVFNLFMTVFPVKARKHTYYVQILDDITKQEKLREYQNTFIKIAAHDIRSPLAGIQLMSEVLAKRVEKLTQSDLNIDVESLHAEVVRAGQLVSTLLDISLFETGKIKLSLGKVRMCQLIDEAVVHARRMAPTQRFSVRCRDDITVSIDRERIREVLVNLLENAVKYAPGKPIMVSVAQKKTAVVVSVLDRGRGIPTEAVTHIFQLFYRTSHTKKTKIAGYGLGLHIAHKIIQAHHGRIWVSPRKGGGSVFSFTLPHKDSVHPA